ncbi:hypothetical protein BU26DRAFT_172599 [Trematosphaeria pertusa]|uniref:Uncharacterized protein n=1 Tax=Trematosphaeria pertusa TaxID=390896 RepID=A0A6A6HU32_9PLEO|nr:uncharacterized protein BU26DRAFT_172599 [Trematosphaeria pertusa]KAF2241537.1 hypothetical protein BU26DRAFT_172599 [Trematosphaeria pertusa]
MPNTAKRATKALPAAAIPEPFEPASAALARFLSTFDKDNVYITHIDNHPAWFKRRIFFVPVGINVVIAALLLWRAYAASPFYWSLLMSLLGNRNETTIYYTETPWGKLIKSVVWRMLVFLFDWLLFRIVGPWPWSFFLESPGNPVTWRFTVGFRDEEVYVRQSRGWGAKDLLGEAEGSSGKAGGDSPFFKTRILPAVDMRRLREKTGYLLMDGDFDLDFGGMITATKLLDKKEITADLLRTSVFVWVGSEETGQWAVWNCWKLDEGSETEARQKIMLFKDRLTAMGKESLFFKWVELVQFESNAPGGFTYERQAATAEKAKTLFEEEGIDFDKFIRDIGGLGGMPGMD